MSNSEYRCELKQRLFSWTGADFKIVDDYDRVIARVSGKSFSLRGRMTITDADGHELVSLRKKYISYRPTFRVEVSCTVAKHGRI